ncbi:hypothetical protein OC846_006612 [Tilletia horrida]|uniref:Carboxylesterase type B domain-containing protein n=1 Tax=Tilletia horrida TaxID=155126 RepID=A0AAN6GL16_9BASI|nr:hypothetical protein OC846_006612 [Tilletia horrida]KAK0566466.1 hypothetical protein OC861_003244 [Tilletia horrida]
MRSAGLRLVVIGLAAVLLSPVGVNASPTPTSAEQASRTLNRRDTATVSAGDQGTFMGLVVGDQEQYYGIPFAQPPTGTGRFRKPQPVQPYSGTGTRDATIPGHVCWQSSLGYMADVLDEDCLVLNIYKPTSATSDSKLPVMVWIHGGGWQTGSSTAKTLNATDLVDASIKSNQPIVFVSIQYRLGVFGFLGGQEVANAAKAGNIDLNVGLYDQRLALQWVRQSISNWGGDPDRITAFGQSAGAASVSAQMIADGGKLSGLFSGGIMQSGSAANYPRFYPADPRPQQMYSDLLSAAACSNLACLQTIDAKTLNKAADSVIQKWVSPFVPVIDPFFFPLPPSFAFASGNFADIPFITGTCLDDGTFLPSSRQVNSDIEFADFLSRQYGNQTSFGLDLLSLLYPTDPSQGCPFRTELWGVSPSDPLFGSQYKRTAAVITDLLFLAPKRMQLYGVLNNKKQSQAWSYLFAQRSAGAKVDEGVNHGSDVDFTFAHPPVSGTASSSFGARDSSSATQAATQQFASSDDVIKTSQMMVSAWLAFAYNRNPNTNGVPNWPAYDMANAASLQFQGSNTSVIPDTFRKAQTDMFLANPFTWWI